MPSDEQFSSEYKVSCFWFVSNCLFAVHFRLVTRLFACLFVVYAFTIVCVVTSFHVRCVMTMNAVLAKPF